jgi:O-antigen/teichoic acid export membrane protein
MMLISSISLLGLDTVIMRFLPTEKEKSQLVLTICFFICLVTGVLALGAVLVSPQVSAHLAVLRQPLIALIFITFTLIVSLNSIYEALCIAYRQSRLILIKTALFAILRQILIFSLLWLGSIGIVSSLVISILIAGVWTGILFLKKLTPITWSINLALLGRVRSFSAYVYTSGLISTVPGYVIPLLVTNLLSPTMTAYYFIAGTIANTLYVIPQIVTQAMLVEGAYEIGKLRQNILKAYKVLLALLLPGVGLFWVFGDRILSLFGKQYSAAGLHLLRWMVLAAFLVGLNYIFGTVQTIKQRMKVVLLVSFLNTCTLLVLCTLFLKQGLESIGIATIVSQTFMAVVYIIYFGIRGELGLFMPHLSEKHAVRGAHNSADQSQN